MQLGVETFESQPRIPLTQEDGEAVEVEIVRSGGTVVERIVEYFTAPGDPNEEFYGGIGLLLFLPGETSKWITLIARADGYPEVSSEGETV